MNIFSFLHELVGQRADGVSLIKDISEAIFDFIESEYCQDESKRDAAIDELIEFLQQLKQGKENAQKRTP